MIQMAVPISTKPSAALTMNNDSKLIATARSGLDSTQTRQALVAATTDEPTRPTRPRTNRRSTTCAPSSWRDRPRKNDAPFLNVSAFGQIDWDRQSKSATLVTEFCCIQRARKGQPLTYLTMRSREAGDEIRAPRPRGESDRQDSKAPSPRHWIARVRRRPGEVRPVSESVLLERDVSHARPRPR